MTGISFSRLQSQEEFYSSLPYDEWDPCLDGRTHGVPTADVAGVFGPVAGQLVDADSRQFAHSEHQR
jgi:hypothetical protein